MSQASEPSYKREPGSFRDPSGHIFSENGTLYRHVAASYGPIYDHLISSGLYGELVEADRMIPHTEVDTPHRAEGGCYRVLRPEIVPFISYPYEWCFGQLKQAALLTLAIQKAAIRRDMVLKDASAYNVQFRNGRSVFIDTLSFDLYKPGTPWVAYRQFCQHFLAPLALMALTDVRLEKLLATYIDGIPLDLASRLLPRRTYLSLPLLTHLHMHSRYQRKYHHAGASASTQQRSLSKSGLLSLMGHLESAIGRLRFKATDTEWGNYYEHTNYSCGSFDNKEQIIAEWLDRIQPRVVWDLGSNRGRFSRTAARGQSLTISIDGDPVAVERNYAQCVRDGERYILPLLIDLCNPSPAIGWRHRERRSLTDRGPADVVMALALIHHLSISNQVPFADLARFFEELGRIVIIEFVPKEDSQVQRLLHSRQDVFTDYDQISFESAFRERFVIEAQLPVKGSARRLYLMRRRGATVDVCGI